MGRTKEQFMQELENAHQDPERALRLGVIDEDMYMDLMEEQRYKYGGTR